MSNMIHVHVDKKDKFELTEAITNEENYNVLYIGEEVRVFMSTEQVEKLFNELDLRLHKEVYTVLEDKCLNLELDIEKANELIEDLEDKLQENFK